MNRVLVKLCIVLLVWFSSVATTDAHDAWLAAKWDATKNHIIISPVVAEVFPNGEPIKDMKRFVEPRVYFPDGRRALLHGDPKDSTILGAFPSVPTCIVASGVKQREITYDQKIAWEYLTEEIGLTKDEAAKIVTPGVKEFSETYGRYLKTLAATGSTLPKDTALGFPLELVLFSWKATLRKGATLQFRLLEKGKPVAIAPVRVLSNGKTTIVMTDSNGMAQATVVEDQPILLAHIQVTKLSDRRLQSIWTNLAIYRLEE